MYCYPTDMLVQKPDRIVMKFVETRFGLAGSLLKLVLYPDNRLLECRDIYNVG